MARLAQSAERKALDPVVAGLSPTVGVYYGRIDTMCVPRRASPEALVNLRIRAKRSAVRSSLTPHHVLHYLCRLASDPRKYQRGPGLLQAARLSSGERSARPGGVDCHDDLKVLIV